MIAARRWQGTSGKCRGLSVPALFAIALTLSACGDFSRFALAPTPSQPSAKPARLVMPQSPATEKEHDRILAAYGGGYDDSRLEELITKTVNRLVAASERPDLAYRVTILNSAAVNAFALPTGQLYVTRGLVALATDTSELASVLSHEMAHRQACDDPRGTGQAGCDRQPRGQRYGQRS
jgi:predicted Zn-dependent protease